MPCVIFILQWEFITPTPNPKLEDSDYRDHKVPKLLNINNTSCNKDSENVYIL
jgi:hypothetical protein